MNKKLKFTEKDIENILLIEDLEEKIENESKLLKEEIRNKYYNNYNKEELAKSQEKLEYLQDYIDKCDYNIWKTILGAMTVFITKNSNLICTINGKECGIFFKFILYLIGIDFLLDAVITLFRRLKVSRILDKHFKEREIIKRVTVKVFTRKYNKN